MPRMSETEWRHFISQGTRTGKLATVCKDGRPHVVPVWFVVEGDELVFMTGADTVKARNMRRDPRVAVSVDDERFPYSFAMLRGTATLETPTPDELFPWGTRIARRYVPEDAAEDYGRRNSVEGELLVRVAIDRVIAYGGIAE